MLHAHVSTRQVLVGSLELVIFERFEPQHKTDFDYIFRRSGYDAVRKTMLLDAHLRALRYVQLPALANTGRVVTLLCGRCKYSSAGFAFSTVLLQDGEFVHVNKVRFLSRESKRCTCVCRQCTPSPAVLSYSLCTTAVLER